jgi:TonB-dependent SusC/RagA subfamily outer membrane receptor
MSAICHAALLARRYAVRSTFALGVTMFVFTAPRATAQTGIVIGSVTDRGTGQPIDAARAQVVGTSIAVGSDSRGAFLLRGVAPGTYVVRVSRIGFRPAQAPVTIAGNDTARVALTLTPSAVELDQVVVTGTGGAVERKKLGSSFGSLDMTQLQEQMPVTDIGQALSAKIPGLRSAGVGGGAGAARDIRIRGYASLTLDQRPVIYIDGVRMDRRATEWTGAIGARSLACCAFSGGTSTDRLNDLNPEDIERVEVLKGAAAATLYGSEASNGVIQIFTKRGKSDSRPSWSLALTSGFDRLRPNLPTKRFPLFTGTDGTRARDANDLIESGPYQNYDMSVQGGGQRNTYYASAGYADEEGSIQPNWDRRGNLRLNLSFLPTDKWTIDARSAFTRNRIAELQAGNNWTALLGNAMNGDPRKATALRPYGEAWVPVSDIKRMQTTSDANRWTGGVTLSYAQRSSLTHRLTAGLDNTEEEKSRFFPFIGDYGAAGVTAGQRNLGYRNYSSFTLDYLGQVTFLLPFDIGSDFTWGGQALKEQERFNLAIGNQFAAEGVSTVSGAAVTTGAEGFAEKVNAGFHLQNRFSYRDRLFVTGGLRIDGNSAFGQNFGFKRYPKADVSWIVSEYGVLPHWVSSMKLRSAYGQAGKAPGAFDKFTTYSARSVFQGTPGIVPDNPGNADLRPETTTEIEGGMEAGFFSDRLGFDATLFWNFTKDALVNQLNPPSGGFESARKVNLGRIDNHGWEASAHYLAIATPKFDWTTTVKLDGTRNKLITLGGVKLTGNQFREGYPVNGVWDRVATGFSVVNGKPITTRSDTAIYLGNPFPTFNGSFGNTLRYGSFSFYTLVTMERGAMFGNGDRAYRVRQGGSDEYLQFINPDGTTTFQADSVAQYWSIINATDSRDNVRLREISLSYTLPERLSGLARVGRTQLTVSGQNVMWWDHCHCADPNQSWAGADAFTVGGFLSQPSPRTYRVAIRTRF